MGSYADAAGTYHAYMRSVTRVGFLYIDLPAALNLTTFFFTVSPSQEVSWGARKRWVMSRVHMSATPSGEQELRFPGSVITEGWNINQDGSVVGHYDSQRMGADTALSQDLSHAAVRRKTIATPTPSRSLKV